MLELKDEQEEASLLDKISSKTVWLECQSLLVPQVGRSENQLSAGLFLLSPYCLVYRWPPSLGVFMLSSPHMSVL